MKEYTKARLFERRQEDLDTAIKGNLVAMIHYYSAKKLGENIFEINQSITVKN